MKHLTFVMPDCNTVCMMTVNSTRYGGNFTQFYFTFSTLQAK